MKPQDIVFFIVLAILLYLQKPAHFLLVGLLSLVMAIPLFASWIFFTAERLTWYAAAFIFIGSLLLLQEARRVQ